MKHRLIMAADVEEGSIVGADLPDGRRVAVYNTGKGYYATEDQCTHGKASLSEEGILDGCVVECPWHFGSFDVSTGAPKAMPCTVALRIYPVTQEDGWITIETDV